MTDGCARAPAGPLAADLKRTTAAAIATYGAFSIATRIAYTVFARTPKGLMSGVWDMVLFALSLAAALTVGGGGPSRPQHAQAPGLIGLDRPSPRGSASVFPGYRQVHGITTEDPVWA